MMMMPVGPTPPNIIKAGFNLVTSFICINISLEGRAITNARNLRKKFHCMCVKIDLDNSTSNQDSNFFSLSLPFKLTNNKATK